MQRSDKKKLGLEGFRLPQPVKYKGKTAQAVENYAVWYLYDQGVKSLLIVIMGRDAKVLFCDVLPEVND
jgi:hypothetical protein